MSEQSHDNVHPANETARRAGIDPKMLAQLGGLDFLALPATTRITFDQNFKKFGSVHGPILDHASKARAELEARATLGLQSGKSADIDAEGNLRPSNMSAAETAKAHDAIHGRDAVKSTAWPLMAEDQMPPEARNLMGRDKANALARVRIADNAKAELQRLDENKTYITPTRRRDLEEKILMGWGGSRRSST